jgi:hypothetical protein
MTRLTGLTVLSLCFIVALFTPTKLGQAAQPKFKKGARIITDIAASDLVSEDGQVTTVLFDFLNVSTNPGKAMPLVVTRTATLNVPMIDNDQDLPITYDVRGFVMADKGSHAALLIQACGSTTLVGLKKAIKDAKSSTTPKPKHEPKKPANMKLADDFYVRIQRKLPAKSSHNVTIFMLVEKDIDDPDTGAALWVDSIDMSLGNQ